MVDLVGEGVDIGYPCRWYGSGLKDSPVQTPKEIFHVKISIFESSVCKKIIEDPTH